MTFLNFTKTVIKNLFSKPATLLYPTVPLKNKERTRGQIGIEISECIYCSICEKKCPTGAIKVVKDSKSWSIDRFDCIQCNCCVDVCPKKCLAMKNEYAKPGEVKTKDVFTNA